MVQVSTHSLLFDEAETENDACVIRDQADSVYAGVVTLVRKSAD